MRNIRGPKNNQKKTIKFKNTKCIDMRFYTNAKKNAILFNSIKLKLKFYSIKLD